jgi:putative ABC transport system permease protein
MIIRELRYAVSGLLRRPAFAATAVSSIGVGIGTATTVLSVLMALLVRPLPYSDPRQLVAVWPGQSFAGREVEALQRQATSYTAISTLSPGWLMALTHVASPRQLDAARVSGDLFGLLGVRPLLGRAFRAEAEAVGRDHVAVLSYDLWQSAFASDPSIVGRSIVLDGEPFVVVAVMPRTFRAFTFNSDLWVPLTADRTAMWWTGATTLVYGRLRPGATVPGASAELATIAPRIQREFQLAPDWTSGARVAGLEDSMVGAIRPTVLLLAGAVATLLALAAANVTTLLLLRAAERRTEMAVRVALGATPGRITTLVLSESLAIGVAGGLAGIGLSVLGVGLLVRILPPTLPRLQEITLDGRVLAASAALTLVVTAVVALVPAWQAKDAGAAGRLRQSHTVAATGQRARGLLVSLEMALALVLVIGATLMGRTVVALSRVDLGLRSDHLLTMTLQPSNDTTDDQLRAYWRAVLARVEAVPGVQSAATILHLPASGRSWNAAITIEGRPLAPGASPPQAHWQVVSAGYFRTAGVRLIRGRSFDDRDAPAAPRVIAVNSAFANRIMPGIDPIGLRVTAGNATQGEMATIVAVVASVRHDSLSAPPGPEVYVPFTQRTVGANSLIVRTGVPPLSVASAIRNQIWAVDRDVPVSGVLTMDDRLAASIARQRMVLTLLALFAGIGLLLGAVGVYGVVAFGAAQRVKEIGIRMALGADAVAIRRLVVGHGLRYAALGGGVGLLLALVSSRVMRQLVYGVPTTDWVSFLIAPAALIAVVTAASWIPARRAAATEPTTALGE